MPDRAERLGGAIAALSIRRPVAVSMFFLGLVLLGLLAWNRLPVELFPAISGDELFVNFVRPGSEPETIEREILLPLEARVRELPRVAETWGQVVGSAGQFRVRFEKGAEIKFRELELRRIATTLTRTQPRGTFIQVNAMDTSVLASFAMMLQVTGGGDRDSLHDLVEELVAPRVAAVPGVSQAIVGGGGRRQVTVWVDPDRAAALGVTPQEVTEAVRESSGRLRYLGGLEGEGGLTAVMLDGRPLGTKSMGEVRIRPDRPVLVRHVAEVKIGPGREQTLFRLNGQSSVGLIIFQEDGANLVRLGRDLRQRVSEIQKELSTLGLELVVGFDGAELVEDQIDRLKTLGLSGFAIALVVLFLFLRHWRAVAVVAVAVPVSLVSALAMLYLVGESLNLITLFGLAVGMGLLVDNSVVVFEAVQRQLERGLSPDGAALVGITRTARAILAASATTAVVFLPPLLIDLGNSLVRGLVEIVALAILLPLFSSLLVAVGLVPLLARHLAAPAAVRRVEERRVRRERLGGLVSPDIAKLLFSGLLASALRRPSGWVTGVALAVLVTVIVALPWVVVNSSAQEAPRADQIQLSVRLTTTRGSLEGAIKVFERLEGAVTQMAGVASVESMVQEEGGSLTIKLDDEDERPKTLTASRVRQAVRRAARELRGVEILRPGEGAGAGGGTAGTGGGAQGLLGAAPAKVVLSGPESDQLTDLATDVVTRLEAIDGVQNAWPSVRPGPEEIRVSPNHRAFDAFGLFLEEVLPILSLAGREGAQVQTGYPLPDGRELPIVVQRAEGGGDEVSVGGLTRLRLPTRVGVLPVASLAQVRRVPPAPVITHHNGRREREVFYNVSSDLPSTGPARLALDREISQALSGLYRPSGTTVEVDRSESSTEWFRRIMVPVVLLLFLVLAMTFESLTLPLLVLLSLPLTLLGSIWALVLAGLPLDVMALLGALALFGLTVNPAILLVDRMQQRVLATEGESGWSAGAAALAAVKERARPVLMTSATTVAGLWPLAIVTGRENEIWPPFATLVMGGLLTSTLLTLLIIPVGFVFLRRLDRLFSRVGPWVVLVWMGATAAVLGPLFGLGVVSSLLWQVVTLVLVAGTLLGLTVLLLPRESVPEPQVADGPPRLEVRHLRKVYGLPGPVKRAFRAPHDFAQKVHDVGGRAFVPADARERLVPTVLLCVGAVFAATRFQGLLWQLVAWLLAGALASRFFIEVHRARGHADEIGRALSSGALPRIAALMPWLAVFAFSWRNTIGPRLADEQASMGAVGIVFVAVLLALVQFGRRTARALSQGELEASPRRGSWRRLRTAWRTVSRRVFGLDLPTESVQALAAVGFDVDRGMVGVLGPNGAGKTTLLRQLAGVLDSTRGTIHIGGVRLETVRKHLARYVGYLPQDAGLPPGLSAREYLQYYAALYQLPKQERQQRIDTLLDEVGLLERADEMIGGYSGGMRQRVAVARTLLRLPPIIVVDEPTVGLDPRERVRFRNLLSRLAKDRIVMFSTHVVEDVAVACDRVLVFRRGGLVFDGAPDTLSSLAKDRVWSWTVSADESPELPDGAVLADQVPVDDGGSRLRVLSDRAPDDRASSVEPSLEDGYLWLVGRPAV